MNNHRTYISPHHFSSEFQKPVNDWSIEDMVEVFYSRTDGWHLEVADRCINGWQNEEGEPSIHSKHVDGRPATHIPDSGWAVLQITLNYFETIAFFKSDLKKKKSSRLLFMWGVFDVFPEHLGKVPNIAKHLYDDLRVGLYHGFTNQGRTYLLYSYGSIAILPDPATGLVMVDPHVFTDRLRRHLRNYCDELLDSTKVELRDRFCKAFIEKYG